jgi:hypothetical protein
MRAIHEALEMIHGFIPTVAIAVVGLSAARLGDLLRAPLNSRKLRNTNHAWSYRSNAPAQQPGDSSQPMLSPCCQQC